jgi:hypothetical protein
MFCPACNSEVPDGSGSCPVCGGSVVPRGDGPVTVSAEGLGAALSELKSVFARATTAEPPSFRGLEKRFDIQGIIGRSRASVVYKVFDQRLRMHFAIKRYFFLEGPQPGGIASLGDKIKLITDFTHPNAARTSRTRTGFS